MSRRRMAQPTQNVVVLANLIEYSHYICRGCKRLPMQPIQTVPGGRWYCEDCFIKDLGQLSNDETMRGFFFDEEARRNIDNLDAKCLTCGFEATMERMEDHVKVCAITEKFQHLAL